MTHELPTPIRGATHVQITKRQDHTDSSIVVHYRFGALDGEAFVPDSLLKEVRRLLRRPTADKVRARAANNGAPTTGGAQEYRAADLLAVMDEEGWEPQ